MRADAQTAGRGRLGRSWVSPPGNLYASRLVRLRAHDPAAATLSLVAGLAVDEAACRYVPADRLMLKWPNDLLLDGGKLAGILLEASQDAVVIGIGVNLAHAPQGLGRAVSCLNGVAPSPPSADAMLLAVEAALAGWLVRWRTGGVSAIAEAWLRRAHPIGTRLIVQAGSEALAGAFAGLDADGALMLRTVDGVQTINAGGVILG